MRKWLSFLRRQQGKFLCLIPVILAIIGGLAMCSPLIFLSLFYSFGIILLIGWGKINERYYPWIAYSVGLSFLYGVTLWSPYLVGSDIHLEYWIADQAAKNGWDPQIPYPQNATLGTTIIIPFLARLLHIDVLWVMKALVPIWFATTPLILYYVFKEWISPKKAILSVLFFIIVPTFFMELTGIVRQEMGEPFLALALYVLIVSKARLRYRLPLFTLLFIITCAFHYALGVILILFLGIGFIIQACINPKRPPVPSWALLVSMVVLVLFGAYFFSHIASGTPLRKMMHFLPIDTTILGPIEIGGVQLGPIEIGRIPAPEGSEEDPHFTTPAWHFQGGNYFGVHETTTRAAIGMDFDKVNTLGKVFRVIQYTTQAFVVIGFFLFWRKRRDYYTFAGVAGLFLFLCVFLPGFSAILNASRFYHITLFILAPAFTVGALLILRNTKYLSIFLVVYAIFTTGIMFEWSKQTSTKEMDLPYSVALSSDRINLGVTLTSEDIKAREWIVDNWDGSPIYTDMFNAMFLQEKMGIGDIREIPEHNIGEGFIPDGAWLFLGSYNEKKSQITTWDNIASRRYYSYDDLCLPYPGELIYNKGARIYIVEGIEKCPY